MDVTYLKSSLTTFAEMLKTKKNIQIYIQTPVIPECSSSINGSSLTREPDVSIFPRDGAVLPARAAVRRFCRTRLCHPAVRRLLPGGPAPAGPVHEGPPEGHAQGGHQRPRRPHGQNLFVSVRKNTHLESTLTDAGGGWVFTHTVRPSCKVKV